MKRDATDRPIEVGDRVVCWHGSNELKRGTVTELLPKTARVKLDRNGHEYCVPYRKCCVYETAQVRMEGCP